MAVRCPGAFLHRHGLHLHPPQLPTGTHPHTDTQRLSENLDAVFTFEPKQRDCMFHY